MDNLEEEKKLFKKMDFLRRLMRIEEHKKPGASKHDHMMALLWEMVWYQSAKKEMPEMVDRIDNHIGQVRVTVEEDLDYEQLTIPGIEGEIRDTVGTVQMVSAKMFKGKSYIIKCRKGPGQYDMLALHDNKSLKDLYKYLIVRDAKRMNKEELAGALFSYIADNPLHLLPALSFSAVRTLLAFAEKEEQAKVFLDADSLDDYTVLLLWGLLSMKIVKKEGELYFAVAVPEEVQKNIVPVFLQLKKKGMDGEQIAGYLEPGHTYNLKRLYQSYDELLIKVKEILLMYGAMEEEEMYQEFVDLISPNCSGEDFWRFIYLDGTFHEELATGKNRLTKQRYIGYSAEVLEYYFKKADTKITKYCKYQSYEELRQAEEGNIDLLSSLFEVLGQWDLYPEEMGELISHCHNMAATSRSLDSMMDSILDQFDLGLVDMACIWRQLVIICLQFPSYLLKGYSRLQAEQEFGRERYQGVFEVPRKVKFANAMIHELPKDFQQQLADMVLLSKQGMIEDVLGQKEQIAGKYLTNLTVYTVIVMNIVDAFSNLHEGGKQWEPEVYGYVEEWCHKVKDTEEIQMMLEWCENMGGISGLQGLMPPKSDRVVIMDEEMDPFYWEGMRPVMQPVIKEEKIYPNAPCPCGSGKKYKKCCGRRA